MFKKQKSVPLVSVCVPVYNSERTLMRCLDSVAAQDFAPVELVIVNDASGGTDVDGRTCAKIVKQFAKKIKKDGHKISVVYKEHRRNLGLVETRRDLVDASSGTCILMLDSDDFLDGTDGISHLYSLATEHNADIANSTAEILCTGDKNTPHYRTIQARLGKITTKELSGLEIARSCFVQAEHCAYLWAKLIKRTVYKKAFELIPFTECTMGEDFLIYFFVCLFAQKYVGTEKRFYRYSVDGGISSTKSIKDLGQWTRVCSVAAALTIVVDFIQNNKEFAVDKDLVQAVRESCNSFLASNIQKLKTQVVPELQDQARAILEDTWSADYVAAVEKAMEK